MFADGGWLRDRVTLDLGLVLHPAAMLRRTLDRTTPNGCRLTTY
jgi:hypothetical protein